MRITEKDLICPFCQENKTEIDAHGDILICDECAYWMADQVDKSEHQNRCEW